MTKRIHVGGVAIGGGARSPFNPCSIRRRRMSPAVWPSCGPWRRLGARSPAWPSPTRRRRRPSGASATLRRCPWWRISILTTAWPSPRRRQGRPRFVLTPAISAARIGSAPSSTAAGCHHIPIRIGVNGGSLEQPSAGKIRPRHGGGFGRERVFHLALLEKFGFYDTCVSMKSSNVPMMMAAYRSFAAQSDYPLHVGVTETGTPAQGVLKSAMGIGGLLCLGIGDTIRVSLTGGPGAGGHRRQAHSQGGGAAPGRCQSSSPAQPAGGRALISSAWQTRSSRPWPTAKRRSP